MFRRMLLFAAGLSTIIGVVGSQVAYADSSCAFTDGFAAIDLVMPDTIGTCTAPASSPGPGLVYQTTTTGTLSWNAADNIPKFTDNFATFSLLPGGLQVGPPDSSVPLQSGRSSVAGVTIGGPVPNQTCVSTTLSSSRPAGNIIMTFPLNQSSSSCYTLSVTP